MLFVSLKYSNEYYLSLDWNINLTLSLRMEGKDDGKLIIVSSIISLITILGIVLFVATPLKRHCHERDNTRHFLLPYYFSYVVNLNGDGIYFEFPLNILFQTFRKLFGQKTKNYLNFFLLDISATLYFILF